MGKGIKFKYNPAYYTLTLEYKTPKRLSKILQELLPQKPEFSVSNYSINTEKIVITVPIQDQWRKYMLPENPSELDYVLLFSDEILLVLQSMYDGASKLLDESNETLNNIKKQIKSLKNELKKLNDYEKLVNSVSTDLYYYIDSYVKNLRQQVYHSELMKSNLEKEIKLYKLIMDSIYEVTIKFVTSYPMVSIEYSDEKGIFQLNVNGSFIDLPSDISNVRDVYTTYKNIFISALMTMKNDVINDLNNYQNSIINLESLLRTYEKMVEELQNNDKIDEKMKKSLVKALKSDIKYLKTDIKMSEGYIKKLKKIAKTIDKTIRELGGENDEQLLNEGT